MGGAIRLLLDRSFGELFNTDDGGDSITPFLERRNQHYVVMFAIMCFKFGVGVGTKVCNYSLLRFLCTFVLRSASTLRRQC